MGQAFLPAAAFPGGRRGPSEIRKGRLSKDDTVVFVHTGGLPIIFAFPEVLGNL